MFVLVVLIAFVYVYVVFDCNWFLCVCILFYFILFYYFFFVLFTIIEISDNFGKRVCGVCSDVVSTRFVGDGVARVDVDGNHEKH